MEKLQSMGMMINLSVFESSPSCESSSFIIIIFTNCSPVIKRYVVLCNHNWLILINTT